MKCPTDQTTLESRLIDGVRVDECPQCKGFWFESHELGKALQHADPDVGWMDFDLWTDEDALSAEWSLRKCPVCGFSLMKVAYADTDVTVDYCPDGHGIWLDRGEFERILKALEEEVSSKHISDYVRASLEEAGELFTGDEGFASEWKDFLTVTRLLQYRVLAENPRLAQLIVALQRSNPL